MSIRTRIRTAVHVLRRGEITTEQQIFWFETGWHQAEKKIYGPHGDAYTATIGRPSALTGGTR